MPSYFQVHFHSIHRFHCLPLLSSPDITTTIPHSHTPLIPVARTQRHPAIINASSGSPPSPPRPPLPRPLLPLLPSPPRPQPLPLPGEPTRFLRCGASRRPPGLQRHPLPARLRLHDLQRRRRILRLRRPRRHALRPPRAPPAGRLHREIRPRRLVQREPHQRGHQLPHLPRALLPPPLAVPVAVAPLRLYRAAAPLRLLVLLQVRQLLPHHLRRHGLPRRHHRRQQQLHLHARRAAALRRRHLPLGAAADRARRLLAPRRGGDRGGGRGRVRRAQGAPRERDGVRRRVRLQDGAGGGGGGAGLWRREFRGAREGRGVQGDGERAVGEDERGPRRRRHGKDGHHRRPQRRHARRLDLQHGHRRRARGRVHGARPDNRQHGGARRAPGRGLPLHGRPHGAGHRRARRSPGHAVRARHAPVLHPVPRLRHRGLRLRQLRRRPPRHGPRRRAPAAETGEGRERRRDGAGPHRPCAADGDRAPRLLRQRQRRVHGDVPAAPRGAPRVPGPAVEGVLPDGVRRVHARRDRAAAGVDALERGLRAQDALLRRVRQRRPRWARRRPEGEVEQPGAQGPRRRLQRCELHSGARVDTQSVIITSGSIYSLRRECMTD